MIQGATETEKSTKNTKESLKILGYQSRVTTFRSLFAARKGCWDANKLTRDLTALQKYSANFAVFFPREGNKSSVVVTFCLSLDSLIIINQTE